MLGQILCPSTGQLPYSLLPYLSELYRRGRESYKFRSRSKGRKLDASNAESYCRFDEKKINVTINGRLYEEDVEPRLLLSHFLRENIGLTGTHIGCIVGECGARTILLDNKLVKSCLHFAVQADGREVTTIEGLAGDDELNPIQETFIKHYALQCGYCTPGMIIASYALLRDHPNPTEEEIRKALAGNLCMCTGYVQIVEAVKQAAEKQIASTRCDGEQPSGVYEIHKQENRADAGH